MPGADVGLQKEDPTIAELLKPLGYVAGQFGKNHLGDKDENSNIYWDWMISHIWVIYEMQDIVGQQIENFVKYPPRQKAASFNLDAVVRQLESATDGANH